jgi:hypothetical protein
MYEFDNRRFADLMKAGPSGQGGPVLERDDASRLDL